MIMTKDQIKLEEGLFGSVIFLLIVIENFNCDWNLMTIYQFVGNIKIAVKLKRNSMKTLNHNFLSL